MKEEIKKILKDQGLDVAEDALQETAKMALEIVEVVVKHSPNKYDDMVWAAVKGKAEELLEDIIDKVDGKEG